jgi:hypothetical protein
MLVYDNINLDLVTLSDNKVTYGENRFIIPIQYSGDELIYNERNKFYKVNGVETNTFGKQQLIIKSKSLANTLNSLVIKLSSLSGKPIVSPVLPNGSIRLSINKSSSVRHANTRAPCTDLLDGVVFTACISIVIPTIYTSDDKNTMQVLVRECLIVEFITSELEIDLRKLTPAD